MPPIDAHILITHSKSNTAVWSSPWPWIEPFAPSARTYEQARNLANTLARALQADPNGFEAAARRESDDRVTREMGGVVGVLRAPNCEFELLDAYEHLRDNEVSFPFETASGVHIIKRVPVPVEKYFQSRRVVVMYNGAVGQVRAGRRVTRTRSDARLLAGQLLERVRANPDTFASLIETDSDDYLADAGGEVGPQSNLAGGVDISTHVALARLQVMEISDVLDDYPGFTILQRLPDRAIERRAFEAFIVAHENANSSGEPYTGRRTEEQARALAGELVRTLSARPAQFMAAREEICADGGCGTDEVIVSDGRVFPLQYRKLANLPIGAVAASYEAVPDGFMVYRRAAVAPSAGRLRRVFDIDNATK
jgi:hypothetical protein